MNALLSDIKFQFKQGFYVIYVLITIMYIIMLTYLPGKIANIATPLVIFSDPSVLGLFFIGGIIMLEKVQGVIQVLVVTPMKIEEYFLSKILSLSIISIIASVVITLLVYKGKVNYFILFIAIFLTSSFFTLYGFYISASCKTINQYFVKMVPYMLLLAFPCFSVIGFPYSELFTVVPSVAALRLLLSAYNGANISFILGIILYLCLINYITFKHVVKVFENKAIYGE